MSFRDIQLRSVSEQVLNISILNILGLEILHMELLSRLPPMGHLINQGHPYHDTI